MHARLTGIVLIGLATESHDNVPNTSVARPNLTSSALAIPAVNKIPSPKDDDSYGEDRADG